MDVRDRGTDSDALLRRDSKGAAFLIPSTVLARNRRVRSRKLTRGGEGWRGTGGDEEAGGKEGEGIDGVLGKKRDPVVWLRGLFVTRSTRFFIRAGGRTFDEQFGEARGEPGGVGTLIGIGGLASGKPCLSNWFR